MVSTSLIPDPPHQSEPPLKRKKKGMRKSPLKRIKIENEDIEDDHHHQSSHGHIASLLHEIPQQRKQPPRKRIKFDDTIDIGNEGRGDDNCHNKSIGEEQVEISSDINNPVPTKEESNNTSISNMVLLYETDMIQEILSFVGQHQYYFVCMINQTFYNMYHQIVYPNITTTYYNTNTIQHAILCYNDAINHDTHQYTNKVVLTCLRNTAVKRGNIDMLQFLFLNFNEHATSFYGAYRDHYEAGCIAAQHGYLHIMKWLSDGWCTFNDHTFTLAATNGHLSVIQYLLKEHGIKGDIHSCIEAARNGHLHIIQWMLSNNLVTWDPEIYGLAALNNHVHIIHWGLTHDDYGWDDKACTFAAAGGHLDLLRWLRERECPWKPLTCTMAASNGHLSVLQWARNNGCPWDEETCSFAAGGGHFDVLKWARSQGCPWDGRTCLKAAFSGHLDILQWAHARGCPLIAFTFSTAVSRGKMNVIEWLHSIGCPWDETACSSAAGSGHLDILQWLRANGCPWDTTTCANAALSGHLHILKWARANGCPWGRSTCKNAIRMRRFDIYMWAKSNGCRYIESKNDKEAIERYNILFSKEGDTRVTIIKTKRKKRNINRTQPN